MKFNVGPIVKDHYATLRNARSGKVRPLDYIQFGGLPLVVGVLVGLKNVRLHESVSVGLLTVTGLLTAFLFQVMLQATQRALDWADAPSPPSVATSRHAKFMGEIAANAGYASLVSILACSMFVVSSVASHTLLRIATAMGLALLLHLGLALLMVMRRVYILTIGRLRDAEAGVDGAGSPVASLERRRNSG